MTKTRTLTPWRDAWSDPPTLPGPYQVTEGNGVYRKWDGVHWYWGNRSPDYAMLSETRMKRSDGAFRWRGLAENPNIEVCARPFADSTGRIWVAMGEDQIELNARQCPPRGEDSDRWAGPAVVIYRGPKP